ncbi:VWA domain-containing protein [Jhaorihella thermophila]|uniref:Ca-activated chloride channel family protein n=1 Tax=Jhaorihella thermophila TaxID=488547 RepID=A0A1H5VSG3_9RHOB|nr:VWA domain-containing protein [Jhaorihella thermophila]SEF90174.1 Ca-activated chloride channel family protein [Jhaorihella thermophila]
MITLAHPWVLLLLPLPWLVWRFAPVHRERVEALRFPFFRRIVKTADIEPGPGAVVRRRTRGQMAAAIAIWALLVLAIAGPQRLGDPVEKVRSARDVVLAIDISGSMDTVDFATPEGDLQQRLAAVKQVVRDFVAQRDGDRVALIVFGTRAFLQAPLTEDLDTIADLVDQTQVGMAGPHTALGDAIGLAIRTFEASEVEQRLMILLSDGADTGSRMSPLNAAEIARDRGVEIHTVAVGDPEGGGENRVDTRTLRDIAARTGGQSFFASDTEALRDTYAQIDRLTPRLVERLSYRPRTPLAHHVLALAAVIGVAALGLLTARKARRTRA